MRVQMELPFELEILSRAHQYQRWVADTVRPHLGNRILEVGSGIGNMSKWLPARDALVLSEADQQLLPALRCTVTEAFGETLFSPSGKVHVEQLDLSGDWTEGLRRHELDTVVSFNVLEHVEDDAAAMAQMLGLLRESPAPGIKRLVTFVPAHSWAYGSIDRGYGHYRRYGRCDFTRIAKRIGFEGKIEFQHFNLAGLPGWFMMNRVLKKKKLGLAAVDSFERLCPWIRGIDDFVHSRLKLPLGQSLLVVMTLQKA